MACERCRTASHQNQQMELAGCCHILFPVNPSVTHLNGVMQASCDLQMHTIAKLFCQFSSYGKSQKENVSLHLLTCKLVECELAFHHNLEPFSFLQNLHLQAMHCTQHQAALNFGRMTTKLADFTKQAPCGCWANYLVGHVNIACISSLDSETSSGTRRRLSLLYETRVL